MNRNCKELLVINNLCAGYDEKDVIRDISLCIGEGEILGIAGESGSGKTTLLKSIIPVKGNSVSITQGSISYEGNLLHKMKGEELREIYGPKIGFISQNPGGTLNPIRKTGKQFIETMKSHRKINTKEAKRQILGMLEKMHFEDAERIMECYPYELSGGMKQRAAIALAMIMEPKLILADEPTSALDVNIQAQIINELKNLRDDFNTSILIVTHNMGIVSEIADNVAIMHGGRIVEYGKTKEILKTPEHPYTRCLMESIPKIGEEMPKGQVKEGRHVKKNLLEVKNVSKVFKNNKHKVSALDNLSFTMGPGEIFGIVGESGSGKSTIAKIIMGITKADHGEIWFDDENITGMEGKKARKIYRKLQAVFQNPVSSFDIRMRIRESIGENITNLTGIKNKVKKNELIDRQMHYVGLEPELADRYPGKLSGGQCQRAAIARAVLVNPKLLICDEVTSALDVSAQAKIVELLCRLSKESNMGIIFISHDLALVSCICDHVIVMQKGKCVESGTAEQIINYPREEYTRLLLDSVLVC